MSDEEPKPARPRVADELRRARKAAGMTQRDFADAMGVSLTTIKRWETGERFMSTDKLDAISEVLGIRLLFLREEQANAVETLIQSGAPRKGNPRGD
ncbi:MAG: helix-turn-helix transcriptional regulator [Myxococcales bacterium]|nr:helix-turn-helix transcriptional regulator [Myxococcales bacterium]